MDIRVAFSTHDKTEVDPLASSPLCTRPSHPFAGLLASCEEPRAFAGQGCLLPHSTQVSLPAT